MKTLAELWAERRGELVRDPGLEVQLRRAFYTGGAALFYAVTLGLDSMEPSAADLERLRALHDEIRAFSQEVL